MVAVIGMAAGWTDESNPKNETRAVLIFLWFIVSPFMFSFLIAILNNINTYY